ncbi:MAG: hypothetical protein KC621_30530 [Myxococcales bacterium]|nr:hypothetical protein [Myxococcales bacterium]
MWTAPLTLTVLASCTAMNPQTAAATAYLDAIRPLMIENSMLADRVLVQAAAIYNEAETPKEVAAAWETEIVPVAEHLADQAGLVVAPGPYQPRHAELVSIWTDRATAYRSVAEAIRVGDPDAWMPARKEAENAKIREENWFNQLNENVVPLGIPLVDEYP